MTTQTETREATGIIRKCVHCGFCTATCPTYLLLGDELDSPRGRIVLIKDMLASDAPPAPSTVKHIDRCLSCLSCATTCPSGVDYMHLIDHAREHIEATYRRPPGERLIRSVLANVLSRRAIFRFSTAMARAARPIAGALPKRLRAMAAAAPARPVPRGIADRPGVFPATGPRIARIAMLSGCVQPVLAPSIDDAAVRLLTRHGVEVVIARTGCCGALPHHMGRSDEARHLAKANIIAWEAEIARGLDAIVVTTSGCGTTIKDYGHLFAGDPQWQSRAARVAALAKDITEVMATVGLQTPVIAPGTVVAYHSACSMQHGQRVTAQPRDLLAAAGFAVREIGEGHICCGSAGTYSILQPELSSGLRDRKLAAIERTGAAIVATGNIGCISHLGGGGATMIHTVELLDWATGGPRPAGV
ncbi:MAG: glycolate oxidase subunit GlcF [Janthinobacterium lividum]